MIKNSYMDVNEIRRANLRNIAAKNGTPGGSAKLARKLGITDSQMGQLIGKNPKKNIGNTLARRFEAKLGLAHGWLDQPHAVPMLDQDLLIKAIKLADEACEREDLELPHNKRAMLYMQVFKRLQAGSLDLGEIQELARMAA